MWRAMIEKSNSTASLCSNVIFVPHQVHSLGLYIIDAVCCYRGNAGITLDTPLVDFGDSPEHAEVTLSPQLQGPLSGYLEFIIALEPHDTHKYI